MGELVHKIHTGSSLTNKPYYIVGYGQSVHDYSEARFPQDLRHCETCHSGGAQSDFWRTRPSRAACGSCHDNVDFATGANHSGGIPQTSDRDCQQCHRETLVEEFDRSVPGSHVVPYESSVNPQLELTITEVTAMTPGSQPSVRFTIADKSGPVDVTSLDRVAVVVGGPTSDFRQFASLTIQGFGSIGDLTVHDVGDYTFTPAGYTVPVEAEGTWSVGMEARTVGIVVKPGGEEVEFGANNPVVSIDVVDGTLGGGSPVARREVIEESRCNACHYDLVIHGNLRTEIPYCQICHNPRTTDEARRPGVDPVTNPPASVDLKVMVHRIHTGEELTDDYTVYGFGGTPHNYNEVVYPGNRSDCEECHVPGTYLLPPEEGAISTVISVGGVPVPQPDAVLTPSMAACLSCHDDPVSADHGTLNAVIAGPDDWAESCTVCHGEGKESAVSEVHSP
jgi:OmcA/MtrC family decaheme c-type cytochrome